MAIVSGDMTSAKDMRELKVTNVGIAPEVEWKHSIPAAERGAYLIMALKSGELIKMDFLTFMDMLVDSLDAREPEM